MGALGALGAGLPHIDFVFLFPTLVAHPCLFLSSGAFFQSSSTAAISAHACIPCILCFSRYPSNFELTLRAVPPAATKRCK